MGPPGFEPESMAPEATRMPSYPTGPNMGRGIGVVLGPSEVNREVLLQNGPIKF